MIIGGRIVGLSVLYHLARLGWRNVVLLETNELTSGTPWDSGAVASPMRRTRAQTALARHCGALFERLSEEAALRRGGHLDVATSQERQKELKHTLTRRHNFRPDRAHG